jgi:3-methyladenine DNA glycosylase Tag
MEAPAQIQPRKLADYLDVMSKAVFQPGMSWKLVDAKWPGTRAALHDFDPVAVAGLSPSDVDRLLEDARLIRNRKKLDAVVHNARTLLELDARHGGFQRYLRSHTSYDALASDLRQRFRFLGEMGCYYFLYVVGEPVPPYEEWHASRAGARQRATRPGAGR